VSIERKNQGTTRQSNSQFVASDQAWTKEYVRKISSVGTGVDPGFSSRAHQQDLTTGPFENTCEADAVSPEVSIGGCRTHVSTTKKCRVDSKQQHTTI